MLVVVSGLPGTGKTWVSEYFAKNLPGYLISSDKLRRELLDTRTYSEKEKDLVYKKMLKITKDILKDKTVIVDATFYKANVRKSFLDLAKKFGKRIVFVECVCKEKIVKDRLDKRSKKISLSEATFEVYKKIKMRFEPIKFSHWKLDTTKGSIKAAKNFLNSHLNSELLVENLLNNISYPHKAKNIELFETHISYVFLAGDYAYKIKKPVKFNFLDYSSLNKRKLFCEKEVKDNSRLAPEMYLGVEPIGLKNGTPLVGYSKNVVEYCVKMERMPKGALMSEQLEKNKIKEKTIEHIAIKIGKFHNSLKGTKSKDYGSVKAIRKTCNDLFFVREFLDYELKIGRLLDDIQRWINDFLNLNKNLFIKRKNTGFVKNCHGDFHSKNVFLVDNLVFIFDCIEFNPHISHCDTMAEIGYFLMDLDYHDKPHFETTFLDVYLDITKDFTGLELLNFYKCYRACVKGMVNAVEAQNESLTDKEKKRYLHDSWSYWLLAKKYSKVK